VSRKPRSGAASEPKRLKALNARHGSHEKATASPPAPRRHRCGSDEDRAAQGLQHYDPFNRDGCRRKQGGNEEKWMRRAELLLDVSVARAAFEIPKLARIKVAPPPPEEVTMEIRSFDSDGKIEELRRERDRRPRAARERRGADPDDMVLS
jgi:hypothetical protein